LKNILHNFQKKAKDISGGDKMAGKDKNQKPASKGKKEGSMDAGLMRGSKTRDDRGNL